MDDTRIWECEKSLWTGDADHYRALIDEACLMVVPAEPYLLTGEEAASAMADTPRWTSIDLVDGRITRPQEGLIVIAYTAHASRGSGDDYTANCTSTYRRLAHDDWRVVQHQQTPPLRALPA